MSEVQQPTTPYGPRLAAAAPSDSSELVAVATIRVMIAAVGAALGGTPSDPTPPGHMPSRDYPVVRVSFSWKYSGRQALYH